VTVILIMHTYYLHLGSNQGNKKQMLDLAIAAIEKKLGNIIIHSSFYETEPWGLKEQDNFINLALQVKTPFEISEVIKITKSIETELGGQKSEKWGPRNIDIDILYCDDMILQSEELTIPHPQLYNRNFVLVPMIEIAGDFIDPIRKVSIDELYDECTDEGEVFLYED